MRTKENLIETITPKKAISVPIKSHLSSNLTNDKISIKDLPSHF